MIRYYVYAYVMFRSQLKRGADCKCYTDNIIGNLINKVLDVKPLISFIIKIMPIV